MKSLISRTLISLIPSIKNLYRHKKEQLNTAIEKSAETTNILIQWSSILGRMLADETHRQNLFNLGSTLVKAKLDSHLKVPHKIANKLLNDTSECLIDIVKDKTLIHSITKNKIGIDSIFKRLLKSSPEALEEIGVDLKTDHKHIVEYLTSFSQSALKLIEDNPNESATIIKHIKENIDLKQKDIEVMPLLREVAPEIIEITSNSSFNETLTKATKAFPNSKLSKSLVPMQLWQWEENYLTTMIKAYIEWNLRLFKTTEYIFEASNSKSLPSKKLTSKPISKAHRRK